MSTPAKSMLAHTHQRTVLWAVLLCVALNAVGQILFKSARAAQPDAPLLSLFLQLETWTAFIVYGISTICWLWILSRADLSFTYPMLSLSFPVVVGLSAVLFSESVSLMRWTAIGAIVVGVYLLAKT